jgi:hypothetical protein
VNAPGVFSSATRATRGAKGGAEVFGPGGQLNQWDWSSQRMQEVPPGPGRIVALYCRPSTSYQIH